jgi:acyl-CoA thioester hydrolase
MREFSRVARDAAKYRSRCAIDSHRLGPTPPIAYDSDSEALETTMEHDIEIDVRYYETDGQGVVHHANYFQYFELARVEMLKAMGHDYAELERDGIFLVVHSIACKYHRPARFGDRIRIYTKVARATMARIDHQYRVFVRDELIAEASSTIACIDRNGQIRRMPEILVKD